MMMPSADDAESEKGGEPAAMQADDDPLSRRKLEEKFETAASINHLGPEASTSSQSTEPEFLDSKEEQEPEQSNGLPAALVAAEVIPTSVSPTESSLQSETSLRKLTSVLYLPFGTSFEGSGKDMLQS